MVLRDGPTPNYLILYTGFGECLVRLRSGAVGNTSIADCTTSAGNMDASSRKAQAVESECRCVQIRSLTRVGTACATDQTADAGSDHSGGSEKNCGRAGGNGRGRSPKGGGG